MPSKFIWCQICKDEVSGYGTDVPARLGKSVVERGSCEHEI